MVLARLPSAPSRSAVIPGRLRKSRPPERFRADGGPVRADASADASHHARHPAARTASGTATFHSGDARYRPGHRHRVANTAPVTLARTDVCARRALFPSPSRQRMTRHASIHGAEVMSNASPDHHSGDVTQTARSRSVEKVFD